MPRLFLLVLLSPPVSISLSQRTLYALGQGPRRPHGWPTLSSPCTSPPSRRGRSSRLTSSIARPSPMECHLVPRLSTTCRSPAGNRRHVAGKLRGEHRLELIRPETFFILSPSLEPIPKSLVGLHFSLPPRLCSVSWWRR
ncbi:hypothetical protein VPH35_123298 [Triticum aestivum]